MFRFFKNLFFLVVFLFGFAFQLAGLTPADIKGTHSIMAPQFQKWSPVEGAIAWESDLLKKFFELGEPEDATIKLIHDIFDNPGGSFVVSARESFISAHLSSECIGQIIGLIESRRINSGGSLDLSAEARGNLSSAIQRLIEQNRFFVDSMAETKRKFSQAKADYEKLKQSSLGFVRLRAKFEKLTGPLGKNLIGNDQEMRKLRKRHSVLFDSTFLDKDLGSANKILDAFAKEFLDLSSQSRQKEEGNLTRKCSRSS